VIGRSYRFRVVLEKRRCQLYTFCSWVMTIKVMPGLMTTPDGSRLIQSPRLPNKLLNTSGTRRQTDAIVCGLRGKKPPEAATWQIQIESDVPHGGAGSQPLKLAVGTRGAVPSVAPNGF
jgi:hypothetical protein